MLLDVIEAACRKQKDILHSALLCIGYDASHLLDRHQFYRRPFDILSHVCDATSERLKQHTGIED